MKRVSIGLAAMLTCAAVLAGCSIFQRDTTRAEADAAESADTAPGTVQNDTSAEGSQSDAADAAESGGEVPAQTQPGSASVSSGENGAESGTLSNSTAADAVPSASKRDAIAFEDHQLYAAAYLGYLQMEDLDYYAEQYLDTDQLPIHYVSQGDYYLIIPRYDGMALSLYQTVSK